MKRRSSTLIALAVAFLVLGWAALTAIGTVRFAFTPFKAGSTETVMIEVKPGSRPMSLSAQLEQQGVIRDAEDFHSLGRWIRQWASIKAGEYRVSPAMTPIEVFSILTSGISSGYRVVVHEGDNMYQVADALVAQGLVDRIKFLRLAKDRAFMNSVGVTDPKTPSLEGHLFPETYLFTKSMGAEKVLQAMVARFKQAWTPAIEDKGRRLGMTPLQTLTLASIIEKETGAAAERRLISSVFHNRLRKRMRLQSDPTTIYGIWETFNGNITRKDLQTRTEYNTYKIPALPIGPISNPGDAALNAAVDPEISEYIFFVSRNDGTHVFTRNLHEHETAVRQFQKDARAREGRSWRELGKKKNSG